MKKNTQKPKEIHYLAEFIERNDYFQRSVNIDLDSNQTQAIENFYCPISYEQVLVRMATMIEQSNQSAFTWTGSYGSGKSSLALFLQALVSPNKVLSELAKDKLSPTNAQSIAHFFDNNAYDWQVMNLVGKTTSPEQLFKEALSDKSLDNISTQQIFDTLSAMVEGDKKLIIFIDELGKTLEAVNRSEQNDDIYFLQQLAEFVNRSQGKIVFIGILHQSFTAYARQAKKQIYNEWLKIQGRFIDCAITLSVDEQLYLISKVINISHSDKNITKQEASYQNIVASLVNNITENKNTDAAKLTQALTQVFPLHPLVAVLLCQLSKKDFGQNQRSIFSFLMSAEPYGFSNYLKQTPIQEFHIYQPDELWDYIDSNLGNMILATDHAKSWLLAQMAVSRYQVRNDELAIRLIKTISLVSLLADDTGVHSDIPLLVAALQIKPKQIKSLLSEFEASGLIFYSKFKQAYLLNEGSDFNLSKAIEERLPEIQQLPFEQLKQFDPIIAKHHYQTTGSLRWMEVKLMPLNNGKLEDVFEALAQSTDASLVGYFCVLLPTSEEEFEEANRKVEALSQQYPNFIITVVKKYATLIDLLKDLLAIKEILKTDRHLINDTIARQETEAHLVYVEDKIHVYLQNLLTHSKWINTNFDGQEKQLNSFQVSSLASDIAEQQVSQAIDCNNELVNRNAPSPNAKGAIRELVKRMIENGKEPNLGIEKFPPEKAIYESILLKNGIHREYESGEYFYFDMPSKDSSLYRIWQCANDYIAQQDGRLITADEIYREWQAPPFGVKAGLCDILYIAYIISRSSDLANYIEGEYKPNLQYLLAEYLLKSPKCVGIREVSHLKNQQPWIYQLKDKLATEFCAYITDPISDEPLPIAQALISVFDKLPSWLQRTNELEPNTKHLRNILKQSNDPNKLLFDDLPRFFDVTDSDEEKADAIIKALKDMHSKYPDLVADLNRKLFLNLKIIQNDEVNNLFDASDFESINNRANAIWKKSGDATLEPFITRLRNYQGSPKDAEGLISLLAGNKPPKTWIDQDIQKALQQLSNLSFSFLEAEINSDIEPTEDRYKVSVIIKSPNIADQFQRNAHVVPESKKVIDNLTKQILELDGFNKLDMNNKVATISELFKYLATNQS